MNLNLLTCRVSINTDLKTPHPLPPLTQYGVPFKQLVNIISGVKGSAQNADNAAENILLEVFIPETISNVISV